MVLRTLLILAAIFVALFAAFGCGEYKSPSTSQTPVLVEDQPASLIPGPQEEKALRERALGESLSETISHFDGLERARVHLILADRSLFSKDRERGSSAAVLVSGPIKASIDFLEIKRFLTASVPELDAGDIKITYAGTELSPGSTWVGPVEVVSTSKRTAQLLFGSLLGLCVFLALGLVYSGFRLRAKRRE